MSAADSNAPQGIEQSDCVQGLLQVSWLKLTPERVVRHRECVYFLTPNQVFACLPAFLHATVELISRDSSSLFFECIVFLLGALEPENNSVHAMADVHQRQAIGLTLELAAVYALKFREGYGYDSSRSALLREWGNWWIDHLGP